MFPIRDHNPSGRTPYVTYLLMAVNIGVFLSYVGLFSDDRALNIFFFDWALIPGRVTTGMAIPASSPRCSCMAAGCISRVTCCFSTSLATI